MTDHEKVVGKTQIAFDHCKNDLLIILTDQWWDIGQLHECFPFLPPHIYKETEFNPNLNIATKGIDNYIYI